MSTAPVSPQPQPRPRPARILLAVVLWTLGMLAVVIAALSWYASTPSFQNRIRQAVISRLETATGGRVELGHFGWKVSRLQFVVDNLTIHGTEAPGQVPYAHIDRLLVQLKILSFFRPKIGLSDLEADHPVFHLIVYPDGTTNQPHPKHPSTGSAKDQIFNLQIDRMALSDGIAILNDRKIPFNFSANNLAAQLGYAPVNQHYIGTIHAEDIVAQRATDPAIHSILDTTLDFGRNAARIYTLSLQSGPEGHQKKTVLRMAGTINNFSDPHFQFTLKGAVDAREIRALTGAPGLAAGVAQVDLSGHGTRSQFAIDGTAGISGGAFREGTVLITGISASTTEHINQDVIDVDHIDAQVAAGTVQAHLTITNWMNRTGGAKGPPQRGTIHANVAGFSLDHILDMVAPSHFRRLGFDTQANGTADVNWVGSATSLTGRARVTLSPGHPPTAGEVPVTGMVDATYIHRTGTVQIADLEVHTPASQIHVSGGLGVYPLTRQTQLTASVVTSNLAEFDAALAAFHLSRHGRSPIPAQVSGQAQFHGDVSGTLTNPDFRGHLEATNFTIIPPASSASLSPATAQAIRAIRFDSLTADASYAAGSLDVSAATLVQAHTTIRFSGHVHGDPAHPTELFARTSTLQGQVQVSDAEIANWIPLTGKNYPATGTLDLQAQVSGTIGDIDGTGHLELAKGSIYGEKYRHLTTDLRIEGRQLDASHLIFLIDGGRIAGNAGYNLQTKEVHFDLAGSGFRLAHIPRLQSAQYPVAGAVGFEVRGSGTVQQPSLAGSLHIRNLSLARESTGFVDADMHTEAGVLHLQLTAHLNTATVDLNSQTRLTGDYPTQARLNIARFNIDPLLRTFSVSGVTGSSNIAASVNVTGPLRHLKQLSGDARVSQLDVTLEGVPIHSQGAIHASLRDGTVHLDRLHIVGPDTDLNAQGTVGIFTKNRPLHLTANGAINMGLAQTLDTDIISSGHVDFNIAAEGTASSPDLTGQVKFTNVNVALEDYTNGLSRMNGTLVFDQDRLEFKDVTAYSGGGLIKVGGFVTYHRGLYADLTADADGVRIRYPQGITSTANAKLRFQGTQASMILSGNVVLTGFSVSPTLNVASLQNSTNGISLPPNPNSPSNRVRLDIRIASAPSLEFQNSFAHLAGNVRLIIRGTLAQPTVLGRVTITEGTANFNGDKFQLQHGEIYFSNPIRIQPTIDITATTRIEDYNINIGLQGTSTKLTPTFRSEPPLSEQDIFSLLAMGRTQEEQQIYNTEQQQAGVNSTADALLGGALNATLSSRIQKLFGGGSVRIDPTFVSGVGQATARITVTEPISHQATLTYATNVNSTAEQLIQGEWRLTQNFSILAVRDESGVFSLIFRLHRRYH